ncbi:hypothetical protein BCR42DRAFT_429873, partial [Absidia repens]
MSTWISFLCPTFIHCLIYISLFSLIFFSLPSNTQFHSSLFPSLPWSSLVVQVQTLCNQILEFFEKDAIDLYFRTISYLKILLSSALPESEETGFEEQFKYLIVSSSVLNEISSQQVANSCAVGSTPSTTHNCNNNQHIRSGSLKTYYMTMGIVALSGSLLFVFSFVNFVGALCFHWPHPAYFPLILLQAIFLGILFLVYRRLRYTKIRRTYQRLLRHLQQIIDVAGVSDHLMDQLVDKIHDVETISQGYTLTPANSMLKQPRSHQSPQTIGMQSMARSILVPYFKSVTTLLQKTSPLTHSANLSTLRGMYNVKALSSTPPLIDEDDDEGVSASICQEQLDYLVYMIRSTRREWFMRLLALEMMTLGHDSARRDYGTMLDVVEGTMLDMEHYTKLLTKKMKKAMTSDLYNEPMSYMDDKNTDQRSRIVLNKLVLLEKHLRNLQTKIVLCRHDANGVSHDKGADQSFNRISDRFGSMEQDISHLLAQWDENKNGLLHVIKDERKSSTGSALPSPPTSPAASMNKVENSRRPRAATPPPTTFT